MRRLLAALTAVAILVGVTGASAQRADPPAALRIMTIGDSLNTGLGSPDGCGYRTEVQRLMTAAGVAVTWTGEPNGTGVNDCGLAYGHGCATVVDCWNSINAWLVTDTPDVVLIQVGTNNAAGSGGGLNNFQNYYQDLINRILSWSPTVTVVASYIPYSAVWWAAAEVDVNIAIINAVGAFSPYPAWSRLTLVNSSRLPCKFLADGIHPYNYDPIGRWYYEGLASLYGLPAVPLNSLFFLDQPRPGYERVAYVCPN